MTLEEIRDIADEVLALDEKATPGLWYLRKVQVSGDEDFRKHVWRVEYAARGMNEGASFHIAFMDTREGGLPQQKLDGALIASYRTAAPDLARALKAVAEALEEVEVPGATLRSGESWSRANAVKDIRAAIERRLVKP